MKAFKYKVSDLTEIQRSHLAWRLDAKTCVGYITAGHIARMNGDWGSLTLLEIFKWAGCSELSAKIHSKKVVDFTNRLRA